MTITKEVLRRAARVINDAPANLPISQRAALRVALMSSMGRPVSAEELEAAIRDFEEEFGVELLF